MFSGIMKTNITAFAGSNEIFMPDYFLLRAYFSLSKFVFANFTHLRD